MKGFWAIVLIVLGVLFLGQNFNLWNSADLNTVFSFWPILLILLGLWLIVKGFKFAWVIMLVALVLSGVFVYLAGFTQNNFFSMMNRTEGENRGDVVKNHEIKAEMEEGVEKVTAEINTGAIQFHVTNDTDKLIEGNLSSNYLDPDLETDIVDDEAKITLDTVSFRRRFMFQDFRNRLNLKFRKDLPLALAVNTGASELNFDLSKLIISNFVLKTGASDVTVRLGESVQNGAKASFEVGASSVRLFVPKSVGVKINSENGLTGENFSGFTKKDGVFYSDGYDTASKKIEVVFRAGASSIEVNRY